MYRVGSLLVRHVEPLRGPQHGQHGDLSLLQGKVLQRREGGILADDEVELEPRLDGDGRAQRRVDLDHRSVLLRVGRSHSVNVVDEPEKSINS